MDKEKILKILEDFKLGNINEKTALEKLSILPFEDLGFAKIDTHRNIRTGFPEVVFCMGKSIEHIEEIFKKLCERNSNILLTRANEEIFESLKKIEQEVRYNKLGRTIILERKKLEKKGNVLLMCAGTADIPIAEEAAETLEIMGNNFERVYDVGVAGIHRTLSSIEKIQKANCIVVVAGMEGALASVVAGLAKCPIVAVPTSIGYGASFNGIAPLLTMLNSCAPGVSVVNIDNGFGAGYCAGLINRRE